MSTTDVELANVDQAKVLKALGLDIQNPVAQATLLLCRRYELDPFLGHMILVKGKSYVTRDGYLHVAHQSGRFDGMEVLDEWETPSGALCCKVAVYRKDMSRPFVAIGRVKKGESLQADPWDMALTRAERRALRRAFDVAGVPGGDVGDLDDDREPLPADEAPFDEPGPEQPALPAATSSKQAAQRRPTLAQQASELKDKDPISQAERDALLARIAGFDKDHQSMAGDRMRNYGLSLKREKVTRLEARSIAHVLDDVEGEQAKAWEERRVAVHVAIDQAYASGLDVDARHRMVRAATVGVPNDEGGTTESTQRLTEAQMTAILDHLERQVEKAS